jgi:hypothetical protein
MANYSIQNSTDISAQIANTTTYISLAAIFATTGATGPAIQTRRVKMYDLLVGTNGTPADNSMEWTVQRMTAGSTQTYTGIVSSRANALDPADASMAAMAYINSSAETGTQAFTAGTNPLYVGVNQRASYRWVAAPGSEIVIAAVSSNGLAVRSKSATGYTGTSTVTTLIQEQ